MTLRSLLCLAPLAAAAFAHAQNALPQVLPLPGAPVLEPVPQPTLSAGQLELVEADAKFENATEARGGAGFASFFAPEATLLSNGEPAINGRNSIAAAATWTPTAYKLSWQLAGAQVLPGGTAGYTWGHYTAVATDAHGGTSTQAGRYTTLWSKRDGRWQVELETSSADAAPVTCTTPPPAASATPATPVR